MAFYEIDCERCSREAEHLLKLEKEMLQYIRQIEGIEKELGKLSGFGTVVSALAKTREDLYHEKDSMKQMGEVLHASIQCYKNTEKKLSSMKPESSIEKTKDGKADSATGEGIHFALDCLGLLPGIGAVFDGINACWYICEGRWGEALLSGLALIPAAGIVAGAGKVGGKAGMKALSHADDIAGFAKGLDKLDDISDAAKGLDKLDDALDAAKHGNEVIKGGSSPQTINNKFPSDNQKGKTFDYTIENGNVKICDGIQEADFVIDMDGNLHIGRGHSYLANGNSVQAAGKMKVNSQGYIRNIINDSGHYQPTVSEALNYPNILRSAGLNVDNAWIRVDSFTSSLSNYVIDSKVFYNGPVKYLPH